MIGEAAGRRPVFPHKMGRMALVASTGGVHVYVASSAGQVPLLHLWDNVTVRGRVVSYFGEREVRVEEPSSISVFGAGALIAPLRMQTGELTLGHEGALVEIAGAVIHERGRDIYVDDGSGTALVYLDPDTHINIPNLKAGDFPGWSQTIRHITTLRVVGVVRRFGRRAELVPRFPSDLSVEGTTGNTKAAKGNAKGTKRNATEGTPTAMQGAATPSAHASATATPTAQSTARAMTLQIRKPTVLTSQKGLNLVDDWGLPFAVALLLLFSASGGMALIGLRKYASAGHKLKQ